MELKVTKDLTAAGEMAFDSFSELPIECDLMLPDYCPDIIKILKCAVAPSLARCEVNGDKLICEGSCAVVLYYTDGESAIRVSEHKVAFSKTIELKTTPESPTVFVSPAVDYVNCRAVSSRRVDVRGAFTLAVRVMGQRSEEVVTAAEGDGIQLRRREVDNDHMIGSAGRRFTVREELELGPARVPADYIIRHGETARMTDCKLIAGKIITKGELRLHILYMPREGERPETADYTLPVSQIIDMEGIDEECGCDAFYSVKSAEVSPKTDLDGEIRTFSVEITLEAEACVTRPGRMAAITDAYSTGWETAYTVHPVTALRRLEDLRVQELREETLELPEGAEEVLDLWCEPARFTSQAEEGEWVLSGKYLICLFARDKEGVPLYFERPIEFALRRPVPGQYSSVFCPVRVGIPETEYSFAGPRQLNIRAACQVEGTIYGVFQCPMMNDLKVDRSRARKENDSALTIYYAAEGENVWEIAKYFGTSVLDVMEENGLEQETLGERKMLLIPQVG